MTTTPQEPGFPAPDEPTGPTDPDQQPDDPDTAQPDINAPGQEAPLTIDDPGGEPPAQPVS